MTRRERVAPLSPPSRLICGSCRRSMTASCATSQAAVRVDVLDRHAHRHHRRCDQLCAMALLRAQFAAEDRRACILLSRHPQSREAALEDRMLAADHVVDVLGLVIASLINGSAANGVAHEHVSRPGVLNRGGKVVLPEAVPIQGVRVRRA